MNTDIYYRYTNVYSLFPHGIYLHKKKSQHLMQKDSRKPKPQNYWQFDIVEIGLFIKHERTHLQATLAHPYCETDTIILTYRWEETTNPDHIDLKTGRNTSKCVNPGRNSQVCERRNSTYCSGVLHVSDDNKFQEGHLNCYKLRRN